MMKFRFVIFLFVMLIFTSCENAIKNKNPKVLLEEGTNVETKVNATNETIAKFYCGEFLPFVNDSILSENAIHAGEAFYWAGGNKITLAITSLAKDSIFGYTIVAGNKQTFKGNITKTDTGLYVQAIEPGTNKFDGIFLFALNDSIIQGTWHAFKNTPINARKYKLEKTVFSYKPHQMLDTVNTKNWADERYIDWTKPELNIDKIKKQKTKMTKQEKLEYEEFEEATSFSSATRRIFELNASTELLEEATIANLSKGDLVVIRNSIYARHGYSFKYRPLRIFFDKQSWYMPMSIDVKVQLTEIEKKNIALLLRYEKNAKEYYDYFGRG